MREASYDVADDKDAEADYEKDGFIELESNESKEKKKKSKKKNNRYQAYCWACDLGQKCLRHPEGKLKPTITDQAAQ